PLSLPDLPFPVYVNVSGNDAFESEELIAREIGYRIAVRSNFNLDIALYEHDYDRLQTNELVGSPFVVEGPPQYLVLPFMQSNGMRGDVRGATISAQWEPIPRWRLHIQYSHIDFDLNLRPGSGDDNALNVAGNSPETQAAVYSYWTLPKGVSVYAGVRYVDDLPAADVPSYIATDLNV